MSVFVALFEYEHIKTSVRYTDFKIKEETYNKDPEKVVHEIVDAVERALNGDVFELDNDIAEKKHYGIESETRRSPTATPSFLINRLNPAKSTFKN